MNILDSIAVLRNSANLYQLWEGLGVWDRICYRCTIWTLRLTTNGVDRAIMLSTLDRMGVN